MVMSEIAPVIICVTDDLESKGQQRGNSGALNRRRWSDASLGELVIDLVHVSHDILDIVVTQPVAVDILSPLLSLA
jgi:hypothetical protein